MSQRFSCVVSGVSLSCATKPSALATAVSNLERLALPPPLPSPTRGEGIIGKPLGLITVQILARQFFVRFQILGASLRDHVGG
jgi:hypothetical protein